MLFLAIFVGIFAAIVTLGIVILSVWKCVVLRKEKLEFLKFKNEQEKSQWGVVSNLVYLFYTCTCMRIYHIDAHLHTKSVYCLLYQNSNTGQYYGNLVSAWDIEMFCDNCALLYLNCPTFCHFKQDCSFPYYHFVLILLNKCNTEKTKSSILLKSRATWLCSSMS